MKYGFVKVASAIPAVKVADCKFNAQQIDTQIAIADGKGVQIIVFPELCITGYSCADLFGQTLLLEEAEIAFFACSARAWRWICRSFTPGRAPSRSTQRPSILSAGIISSAWKSTRVSP